MLFKVSLSRLNKIKVHVKHLTHGNIQSFLVIVISEIPPDSVGAGILEKAQKFLEMSQEAKKGG